MDVMFDYSFDARELQLLAKRAEDSKRLATEKTHEEQRRKRIENEKLRKRDEGPDSSALHYKRTLWMFYGSKCRKPHLMFFLDPEIF